MGTTDVRRCRGCGRRALRQVLDLGRQPASDYFPLVTDSGPDPAWPLTLWFCPSCALVQVGRVDHATQEQPALAVESATSLRHARTSVRNLIERDPSLRGTTVAEFASHHGGSWLPQLVAVGCRDVTHSDEPASLVIDVHALAHEEYLGPAIDRRVARMRSDGRLVFEFHYLGALVRALQFDTIRHGHTAYVSLVALTRLTAEHGLVVTRVRHEAVFGGSVQVELRPTCTGAVADESVLQTQAEERACRLDRAEGMTGMAAQVHAAATALREHLLSAQREGRSVAAYGAPSKAAVLLGVSRVDASLLPFTVDASSAKHGRRIPGCAVPILPVEELRRRRPDEVLVLTWDIADEVIDALEAGGGWGANYVVPLPEPRAIARRR